MSKEGWDELRKAAQSIGFDYNSVADGRMTGLFDLTADQLSELQDEAPTFWAKLDGDVQEYLQNVIDCNTEIESMKDKLNETMTGVSFDSFYDSLYPLFQIWIRAARIWRMISGNILKLQSSPTW